MNDFEKARELGLAKNWKKTRTIGREKFIRQHMIAWGVFGLLNSMIMNLITENPRPFLTFKFLLVVFISLIVFLSFGYWVGKSTWDENESKYVNYINEFGESEIN